MRLFGGAYELNMATDIDIASNALILIGEAPISSFTEPGAGATAAANLYDDTYRRVLSMHPWTFALKEQVLSQLSQGPDELVNLTFAYQIPADHIRTWRIMPHSYYEAVGDFIYSNQNRLLMRYVFKVAETELPAHFIKTLEYSLASDFARLVTESTALAQFYEVKFKSQLASAMAIDSQGHPQRAIIDTPFTDARLGGFERNRII